MTTNVGEVRSDTDYTPFITDGLVSLPDQSQTVPVRILLDTGAAQSFLLSEVSPLSDILWNLWLSEALK